MTEAIQHFRSAVPGSAVRAGRKALRWSEHRLAREAGVSAALIWRVERGGFMLEPEAERIGLALQRAGHQLA